MLMLPRGSRKPSAGATVNWDHPFAKGLLLCLPMYEGQWQANGAPNLMGIFGKYPRSAITTGATKPTWGGNREGTCLVFSSDSAQVILPYVLPASGCTVAIIRRKHDTTLRNGGLVLDPNAGSTGVQLLCPYLDGNIYWRFGGTGGSNQLLISGQAWNTQIDRFVFTAGNTGQAAWRNGVKIGSHTTAITSTPAASIGINSGGVSGDLQDVNFAWFVDYPWPDSLCQWWSSEPYDAMVPPEVRTYGFLAGGAGGAAGAPWLHYAQLRG